MLRTLAVALAIWVLAFSTSTLAQPARRDFIREVTVLLAVDPAAASLRADSEIERAGEGKSSRAAAAYWVKAQASFRLGDTEAARRHITSSRRQNPAGLEGHRTAAYVHLLEGLIARADGDYARAFALFRAAQSGFIVSRDNRGHGLALQSVGMLYSDVGNGEKAARYFALAMDTYSGDPVYLLSLYNNMGVSSLAVDDFDQSTLYFERALQFAQELGIDALASQITLNIALNQVTSRRPVQAEQTLRRFYRLTPEPNAMHEREILRLRARLAFDRGALASAVRLADRSMAGYDPARTSADLWKFHRTAYEIYRAAGLRDKALVQLEAVRRLDEADAQITASNRAALLSAQFQSDAQESRIAQLKAQSLQREVSYQRTLTAIIVAGALLTLALLGGLLYTAIRARNQARADADALGVSNQRLERALAAKTEFLASTSHELRTPLNGILGMTQILLADAAVAARHRTQIELLHDAGTAMRALVDDILDVAKIEHGGFTIAPKPTDVVDLVTRAAQMFAGQAQNAGLDLDLDIEVDQPCGLVDPGRLSQILFNLVGNALKFTPEGGVRIGLRQCAVPRAGDGSLTVPSTLSIAVTDSGIGIAPEWHDSVFDMFRQVDGARTRAYGGTGLGLAICRQLARAMGGEIKLDSTPGRGSTFTLSIPWQPVDASARSEREGGGRDAGAPVSSSAIVIVADDPMRAAMLSAIVRRAGHDGQVVNPRGGLQNLIDAPMLTYLVDGSAWPASRAVLQDRRTNRHIIIVGDHDGAEHMDPRVGDAIRVVAFSRNAIHAALASREASRGADRAPSALHRTAESDYGRRQEGEEPHRSLPVSLS